MSDMNNLGPLADPSPSEKALSALRMACDKIGLTWPPGEDMAFNLITVEARAATMAKNKRDARRHTEAHRCNDTSLAAYWVLLTMLDKRNGDAKSEARHAARAAEHLGWV